MRNENLDNSSTSTILRTIEVRIPERGKMCICSHEGWGLNELDDLRFCEIYSRERYRIKVAFYDVNFVDPQSFAIQLCRAWFDGDGDGYHWEPVELTDCDR